MIPAFWKINLHTCVKSIFATLFMLLCISGLACAPAVPAPSELMFSGKPVRHWIDLAKSRQVKDRKHAVDILGNVGTAHPDVLPALIAALRDIDPAVRLAAVLSLSKIGPPAISALPALESASKDPDKRVGDQARNAIKRIRNTS